jgi:hypothetical protein
VCVLAVDLAAAAVETPGAFSFTVIPSPLKAPAGPTPASAATSAASGTSERFIAF